jgi:hypothetical protein
MNRQATLKRIKEHLNPSARTVSQAGHFALVVIDAGNLAPGIYQDLSDGPIKESAKDHPYMGEFPVETFQLGLDIAEEQKEARVALFVNDWQWVPKAESGSKNMLRADFYENAELPRSYVALLGERGLSEDVLMPALNLEGEVADRHFFSETKLRNQFDRIGEINTTCELNNACAQELVPFVKQAYDQGYRQIVNIVPETCEKSAELFSNEMQEKGFFQGLNLINVYPRRVHEGFWSNVNITQHEL